MERGPSGVEEQRLGSIFWQETEDGENGMRGAHGKSGVQGTTDHL